MERVDGAHGRIDHAADVGVLRAQRRRGNVRGVIEAEARRRLVVRELEIGEVRESQEPLRVGARRGRRGVVDDPRDVGLA